MELIEVQHCHETVRLTKLMCRISTQKHCFQGSMPLKISTLFDGGENDEVYNISRLNCDDVDVKFVRSRTS